MATEAATLRVFRLNDYEWWMAPTLEEAIAKAMAVFSLRADEVADDGARELTDEELDRFIFVDDNDNRRTFREELERRVAAGDEADFFASTEY